MTMVNVPRGGGASGAGGESPQPAGSPPGTGQPDHGPGELEMLRRENALLRSRVARLEREAISVRQLVDQAKCLQLWDFTPYEVQLDDSWVAVDRASATRLLAALAGIDHWDPWNSRIDPRPQP